jgi:hypothetical protein
MVKGNFLQALTWCFVAYVLLSGIVGIVAGR